MSNLVNDRLLESAYQAIDEWEGTTWAEILRNDIKHNDLEALYNHLKEIRIQEAEDIV
jgi:hypothetical protein